jgi:type VII secretion integral membrane protein EccD
VQLTCGQRDTASPKPGYGAHNPTERGAGLLASDPGLRRVSVHADAAVVDVVLPGAVPVAVLIPSIVDILRRVDGFTVRQARRYQLSRPGDPAMEASTTLADNAIRDGDILVLSPPPALADPPRYDDEAIAVSATLASSARPWGRTQTRLAGAVAAGCLTAVGAFTLARDTMRDNAITAAIAAAAGAVALLSGVIARRTYRDPVAGLALSLVGTGFAALAGFLAVPGPPGPANALLAASSATAAAVLALRASGCGAVTLTAVAGVSLVVAAAALVGAITGAPLHATASVTGLVSLGLLGAAGRASIILAGLSPRLPPEGGSDGIDPGVAVKALRADRWLAGMLAAFSSSAAVGAVVTVLAGAERLSCIAFGALTGALLLLRSRGNDMRRTLVFVASGTAIVATTFGAAAAHSPQRGPWVAAGTALLAAGAMGLGFVVPTMSPSPLARRAVELVESAALVAMVPLTCSICGVYGHVRGMGLA